jgi:hypothetical protein
MGRHAMKLERLESERTFFDLPSVSAMRARLLLVSLVGLALLAAAAWAGGLGLLAEADHVYALPTIGGLVVIGTAFGWAEDWDTTEWLADKLPIIGLIGTVLGVLLAIRGVATIDDATRLRIFTGVGEALVANLLGIAGYGWLSLLRRVCDR